MSAIDLYYEYIIKRFAQDISAEKKRKQKYLENLKKDPKRLEHARQKTRERGRRHRQKLMQEYTDKRKDLKSLKFLGQDDKKQLEESYQGIQHKQLNKEKEKAQAIRDKILKGKLDGLVTNFRLKLNTAKSSVKQQITDKMEKAALIGDANVLKNFKGFQDEWERAFASNDKNAKVLLIQNLRAAISAYAENQPEVREFVQIIEQFKRWKEKLDVLIKKDLLNHRNVKHNIPYIMEVVQDEVSLKSAYWDHKNLRPIIEAATQISNYLITEFISGMS